jgi:hypothetical protein
MSFDTQTNERIEKILAEYDRVISNVSLFKLSEL